MSLVVYDSDGYEIPQMNKTKDFFNKFYYEHRSTQNVSVRGEVWPAVKFVEARTA